MSKPHPEILILVITLVCIGLAPVASRLVANIGAKISSEIDGGRSGAALQDHLDELYAGSSEAEEIRQMIEARAFVRGETMPDVESEVQRIRRAHSTPQPSVDEALRDEIRSLVEANNERRLRAGEAPFDVDAEVARRMAAYLNMN